MALMARLGRTRLSMVATTKKPYQNAHLALKFMSLREQLGHADQASKHLAIDR